jgi:hypothetical protein
MRIRRVWKLEPCERIVAEEISNRFKNAGVFFPVQEGFVDLLVVKGQKHIGIRVEESRYYKSRTWPSGHIGHSCHRLKRARIERSTGKVDFYVFLTYLRIQTRSKEGPFGYRFLVVPSRELEKRIAIKDPDKKSGYTFCFHFQHRNVWDEKVKATLENPLAEYSQFLNSWQLIHAALE